VGVQATKEELEAALHEQAEDFREQVPLATRY
jgi:hypothetical protein